MFDIYIHADDYKNCKEGNSSLCCNIMYKIQIIFQVLESPDSFVYDILKND